MHISGGEIVICLYITLTTDTDYFIHTLSFQLFCSLNEAGHVLQAVTKSEINTKIFKYHHLYFMNQKPRNNGNSKTPSKIGDPTPHLTTYPPIPNSKRRVL